MTVAYFIKGIPDVSDQLPQQCVSVEDTTSATSAQSQHFNIEGYGQFTGNVSSDDLPVSETDDDPEPSKLFVMTIDYSF